MLSLLLALQLAGSRAVPQSPACQIALLHTSMLLAEVKNFHGSDRITFVGGEHMPYEGGRESWWADRKRTRAPDGALLSKVEASAQASAMPTCESLASFLSSRNVASGELATRSPNPASLMIGVSLPTMSEDGQSAILQDSVGSSMGGGSGRVCYYRSLGTEIWTLGGCTIAWIAD
jgi:hypothetical protein